MHAELNVRFELSIDNDKSLPLAANFFMDLVTPTAWPSLGGVVLVDSIHPRRHYEVGLV